MKPAPAPDEDDLKVAVLMNRVLPFAGVEQVNVKWFMLDVAPQAMKVQIIEQNYHITMNLYNAAANSPAYF